jgi:hypothetical protein
MPKIVITSERDLEAIAQSQMLDSMLSNALEQVQRLTDEDYHLRGQLRQARDDNAWWRSIAFTAIGILLITICWAIWWITR